MSNSSNTIYHVVVITDEGEAERFTRSSKSKAIAAAAKINTDERHAVRVSTSAGKVVFEAPARPKRVITIKTPKWHRIETHVPELADGVTVPEGYEIAYSRIRVKLLVLRRVGTHGDYLVMDTQTGETMPATNTKETATIMRQIRESRTAVAATAA